MGNKPSTNKQTKKSETGSLSKSQQTIDASKPNIKPSTNETEYCEECRDISHCCLELLIKSDE